MAEGPTKEQLRSAMVRQAQVLPPRFQAMVMGAAEFILSTFAAGRHQIGAAFIDSNNTLHYGLHIEATVGRASICAEAVALGTALANRPITLIGAVAIRHPLPGEAEQQLRVVPPCGLCREVLLDHAPQLEVVLPGQPLRVASLSELLPEKYVGTKWRNQSNGFQQ